MRDIIIDGVSLYDTYGVILLDETISIPPKKKEKWIEIEGSINGDIDASESVYGFPLYENRKGEFCLFITNNIKTNNNLLISLYHGKTVNIKFGYESQYEYRGRIQVDDISRTLHDDKIYFEFEGNPYRYKPLQTITQNCACGKSFTVMSGAKPVQPTITVSRKSFVTINNLSAELDIGTWLLDDLFLTEGNNSVFIDTTYGETGDLTWSQLSGTWSQQTGTWSQLGWSSQARQTKQSDNSYNATITYEWGDL